jgi:hypothetical protein
MWIHAFLCWGDLFVAGSYSTKTLTNLKSSIDQYLRPNRFAVCSQAVAIDVWRRMWIGLASLKTICLTSKVEFAAMYFREE